MKSRILVCPWCKFVRDTTGEIAVTHVVGVPSADGGKQDEYFVHCDACGMSGPTGDTERRAILTWNDLPRLDCEGDFYDAHDEAKAILKRKIDAKTGSTEES